ncbi:MAG: VWA domain-containing protein [Chloroflexi bacterium]|nr:VWA domain-containing protein [Chloroflexota bacterium]
MAYSAEISRANPSCFLFLIDQSGSMGDPFPGGESAKRKADAVADAMNRWLRELVLKCTKDEGPRDYFHVGVIGYGAQVASAFSGTLAGRDLVPITEIANSPARIEDRTKQVEDGAGGLVDQKIRFPIWFDPVANGTTPMCQAFARGHSILSQWISQHPSSFPPSLIDITDGESMDGDPSTAAEDIKALQTSDGNVLLLNGHLSSQQASPVEFPDSENLLPPDQYAQLLFRMSSCLPEHIRKAASDAGYRVTDGTRGYTFNADLVAFIKFLNIGTRPGNLR